MQRQDYKPRLIDRQVQNFLSAMGAVVIEGPKWSGKTWTSSQHCRSEFLLGSPDGNFQNKRLALLSPETVLIGEAPRMLDEWQEVPPLWDAVRAEVDRRNAKGQFILTGSSTPNRKGIIHSGAGRIGRLRMRPMSLFESGDSNGQVSLESLCSQRITPCLNKDIPLPMLASLIVRGGWPGNLDVPDSTAGIISREYIKALLESDIPRLQEKKRDVHKIHLLLRSLARNESTTASVAALRKDISGVDGESVDDDTINSYLDILHRLFILDNQLPFAPGTRSSIRIKQAEKRHLADPSLACALLNLNAQGLVNDLETFGFLFEALCIRDLRIYAESFGAELYHYQDYKGNEFDAVLELPDKRWCGIEIKLGAQQIDAAADNLLRINGAIKDADGKGASSLIVVCGLCNAAYQRKDGVLVTPITMLKP
ncbi:MAG: ATP-binding protein [Victivallales bacterium]|nr:ATP-binding protein [Victivallales bacterium]